MDSICLYCGASPGIDPAFVRAAAELGRLVAESGCTLVFGGGRVGLMGAAADAALAAGGRVVGVIPEGLATKEVAHREVSELRIVRSMHERKAQMAELSDGFVALPGGLGTLEELFETWTWGQLGLHQKPYGLLNVSGFFDPLLVFLDQLVEKGFVRPEHRALLLVSDTPAELLARMAANKPKPQPTWLKSTMT